MPVNIVLDSTISIAVNAIAHKQQRIQLDRQIIECLVLIFHTLFAIIGFDSIFTTPPPPPPLTKNFRMGSSGNNILWWQLMVGLTRVFDTFNGQSVWTITINLIPAVDLMMCTAKLWPAHWTKIQKQQQQRRRLRRRRRQQQQTWMTLVAHQSGGKPTFIFRKYFIKRFKMSNERSCC